MEDTMIEDVQQYLTDQGILGTGDEAWGSFLGFSPDDPDKQVNVLDTGGPGPDDELFDDDGGMIQVRTFQIYVRTDTSDDAYNDGRKKLNGVINILHRVRHQQIHGTYFDYIMANSAGGHIGRDDAGRDEFTANFTARIKTAAAGPEGESVDV